MDPFDGLQCNSPMMGCKVMRLVKLLVMLGGQHTE